MGKQIFMRTRFEWLATLSSKSDVIRHMSLQETLDNAIYKVEGSDGAINADAFNFCNSNAHNDAVIETVEQLNATGAPTLTLKKYIVDLTSQNTYGTFSELSAYRFLLKGGHQFDIHALMDGTKILNPQGSDLDGVLRLPEEIYFDVKGFGFLDHLIQRLTNRLSLDLSPDRAVAESSWDVDAELLNGLLGKQYPQLLSELRDNRKANRDLIKFSMRKPEPIQFTEREIDPLRSARENAAYVFRFAKQFVRENPFFLMFVIHPWFSGSLHVNFANSLETFTNEFAKQTFCRFEEDNSVLFDITRAEAARLLSGIVFVDAWEGERASKGPKYRLFLNPNATNKPKASSIAAFAAPYGDQMTVTQVACSET